MNQGSDNMGSSPEIDKKELKERYGLDYVRIQTSVYGEGPQNSRRARRARRYRPNDERRSR